MVYQFYIFLYQALFFIIATIAISTMIYYIRTNKDYYWGKIWKIK